jgi:lipopolysaccharide transport system permease protein
MDAKSSQNVQLDRQLDRIPGSGRGSRKRQIVYYSDLLQALVVRDLKLLYKRSLLGVAWTLINPLLQLLVFSFVFRTVLRADNSPHYISSAFCGLLIWGWAQSSLFQATGLITGNRPLIRQPRFPVAILPVVTVTTGLTHLILALPVLFVFLWLDQIQINVTILWLPILFALQFLLTVSFAYPLAALNVTFRDTQHTLGVLLQLMFYLLPVFYSSKLIYDSPSIPDVLKTVYAWNPMVILLEAYRAVLIWGQPPDLVTLAGVMGMCLLLLPIGYRIFQHQRQRFVEDV